MADSNTSKIITAFLAAIIAIVLLVVISNEVISATGVTSGSVAKDIGSARTGGTYLSVLETTKFYIDQYPYGGSMTVLNGSNSVVDPANYVVVNAGDSAYSYITLVNGTYWEAQTGAKGNTTTIYYNYYKLQSGWSRTVLNLTPGFIGIAILGIGITLLYSLYKENL